MIELGGHAKLCDLQTHTQTDTAFYSDVMALLRLCTLKCIMHFMHYPNPNQVPLSSKTQLVPSGIGLTLKSKGPPKNFFLISYCCGLYAVDNKTCHVT